METQSMNARVSLMSRMNAFYGIPNLSQETTAAIEQGMPAPKVYSPDETEAPATQTTEVNDETSASPAENFFAATTDQVEISAQAADLQQNQNNGENSKTVLSSADTGASESLTTRTAQPSFARSSIEPAVSSLNSATLETNSATQQPQLTDGSSAQMISYEQSNLSSGGTAAQAVGGNANASQPGAIFSAIG